MADRRNAGRLRLVVTCEHGGNRIPPEYGHLFRGRRRLLDSHRGWDPGALPLARRVAKHFGAPLVSATVSRLLVELNRSRGHRDLFSEATRALSIDEKDRILARYYFPHLGRVNATIRHAMRGRLRVWHLGVHSFTPELDGEIRNADIGILYDPRRRFEAGLARRWAATLKRRTDLRIRLNYPYRGSADGLTTSIRRTFPAGRYAGIEIEINQALMAAGRQREISKAVVDSIGFVAGLST